MNSCRSHKPFVAYKTNVVAVRRGSVSIALYLQTRHLKKLPGNKRFGFTVSLNNVDIGFLKSILAL